MWYILALRFELWHEWQSNCCTPPHLLPHGRKVGDFYLEDVSAPTGVLNRTAQLVDFLASLATDREAKAQQRRACSFSCGLCAIELMKKRSGEDYGKTRS